MEPVVSPWFIYWLGMIDSIGGVFRVSLFLGILSTVIYHIGHTMTIGYESDHKLWVEGWGKKRYLGYVLLAIGLPCAIFMPTKDTVLKMYVASYVTPDNLNIVKGASYNLKEQIKSDVIEILEAVKEAEGGKVEPKAKK